MPIIIKYVDWSETENVVTIKVPLRGVHHSKTLLSHSINHKESKCTFTSDVIVFELIKSEPLVWGQLEPDISKAEKQELKKRYIEEERQRLQQEQEELKNKKAELKRVAVREQMALDAQQQKAIENIKKDEKHNALKRMNLLKETEAKPKTRNIRRKQAEERVPSQPAAPIPPPRSNRTLNVSFTPREFPTPCRESRLEEENEWLRKQAEARRSVGFISEDLRPEEHNPQFLKSKGDGFLRCRNYLAAISAYSFGVKLNDKFADLYVGRAEAHLALGNYSKTAQDCSRALELMKPEVPLNKRERAACIGMRGIALTNLGLVEQGIGELKASLQLEPNDSFSIKLEDAMNKLYEANDNA